MKRTTGAKRIRSIIERAKELSREYYKLTKKPLGITGEVGELEAAEKLDLILTVARKPGFDATGRGRKGGTRRIQIKTRAYPQHKKSQRMGRVDFGKPWDSVVLVILDENYELVEIYEASKASINKRMKALRKKRPGKATNTQKGAISVSMFKSIAGKAKWKRQERA